MDNKELTEEQKKQIFKLLRNHTLKSLFVGFKYGVVLVTANIIVSIVGVKYVHSNAFLLVMGVVNALLVLRHMSAEILENQEKTREEYKKIVES